MSTLYRSQHSPAYKHQIGTVSIKKISKKRDKFQGDRFIPNRSSTNVDIGSFLLSTNNAKLSPKTNNSESSQLKKIMADSFLQSQTANSLINSSLADFSHQNLQPTRLFTFKNKSKLPFSLVESLNLNMSSLNVKRSDTSCVKMRNISQVAERILDAPEIMDDYYLNLMDWGENGLLAVSLAQSVYLWNYQSGEISNLITTDASSNYVCSVNWMNQGGNCLAVGFADNSLQLWDASLGQPIRNLKGHSSRVSSLSWNNHLLSSGSRDTWILNHDIRARNNVVSTFDGHQQEVCGLKWSPDGKTLASGGNDNNLFIWELNNNNRRKNFKYCFTEHTAAVKALSWCPWQKNLLASGGGTADKTMKFWDIEKGKLLNNINVESQVCSIIWNPYDKEILSSHGFSKNQLILWKYPTMDKIIELNGHTNRVLHMSMSPDGNTVVSAAADETLRFWKVFNAPIVEEKNNARDFLQEPICNLR